MTAHAHPSATRGTLHSWFAAAAAREHRARSKHYPALVAAGAMTQEDADTDIEAWRVIAELFGTGEARSFHSYAMLEHATSQALIRREADLAANPTDSSLLVLRDAVWGIHERITFERVSRMRK
jgi:hypothetical protein